MRHGGLYKPPSHEAGQPSSQIHHGGIHKPAPRPSRHGIQTQPTSVQNHSSNYVPNYPPPVVPKYPSQSSSSTTGWSSGSSTSTQGVYSPIQSQPYPSSYPLQTFSSNSSQGGAAVQGPAPHFAAAFSSSPQNSFPQPNRPVGLGLGMASPEYGQPPQQQYMPQQQYNTVSRYPRISQSIVSF